MTIANIPVGKFIKTARKQRGWSQDTLGIDILERSIISKLERGLYIPPVQKIAQLLERLGFSADIIGTDEQQMKSEILACISNRDIKNAMRLIKKLEDDKKFMESEKNQQFIFYVKTAVAIVQNELPGKIKALIKEGLKITISDFNDKDVDKYLLTSNDIQLINQLTILYWNNNECDAAITLMTVLIDNFDKNCSDPRYRAQHYPTLVYNLTSYLHDLGKYKETIPLCDKGIEVCQETHSFSKLPLIIANKAFSLFHLGDKDGSLHLYRQVFYLFDSYAMYEYKEITRKSVKEKYIRSPNRWRISLRTSFNVASL